MRNEWRGKRMIDVSWRFLNDQTAQVLMMEKRMAIWVLRGILVLMMAPLLLVGAVLTILVAGFFGVPLNAPNSPLLLRKRQVVPALRMSRDVATPAHRLLESAPISAS